MMIISSSLFCFHQRCRKPISHRARRAFTKGDLSLLFLLPVRRIKVHCGLKLFENVLCNDFKDVTINVLSYIKGAELQQSPNTLMHADKI